MIRGFVRFLNRFERVFQKLGIDDSIKKSFEFLFWRKEWLLQKIKKPDQTITGEYEPCFTELVELKREDYQGKKVMDVGCGPLGTLEWADMTAERIGLDPLVDQYRKLGIDAHKMKYINAPSEKIPFADGYFDFVTCYNALDHVNNLDKTVAEFKRVLASGGLFLLAVDVNHAPTMAEPITISWDIADRFKPEFETLYEKHYENISDYNEAMRQKAYFDHNNPKERPGMIVLKMRKVC